MAAHDWNSVIKKLSDKIHDKSMPTELRERFISFCAAKAAGEKPSYEQLFSDLQNNILTAGVSPSRRPLATRNAPAPKPAPIPAPAPVSAPAPAPARVPVLAPAPASRSPVPAELKSPAAKKAKTKTKSDGPRRRASFIVERPGPSHRQLNELPPGREVTVNKIVYKIERKIGSGGSCIVYSASSQAYAKPVALKIVTLEDNSGQVFINEINFLGKLQESNHVIKMYDSQILKNNIYVVMELGDKSLKDFLEDRKKVNRMDPGTTRWIWSEMLQCVRVIHQKNIVHADLKPANFVIVDSSLKLIDFGIAAQISSDDGVIHRKSLQGTLNYISPEAVDERPESRDFEMPLNSDVWSLGCILFALVTGYPPFNHIINQDMKIIAIRSAEINFPELEDEALSDVLHQCLNRDWSKRPSVDELLEHPYLKSTITKLNMSLAAEMMGEVTKLTPNRGAKKLQEMFNSVMSTKQRSRASSSRRP